MLARNFMTASDLKITEPERDALITVLGMLERGEIANEEFNMNCYTHGDCGTPSCICGWAHFVSGAKVFREGGHTADAMMIFGTPRQSRVRELFALGPCDAPGRGATPAQAAIALSNFLTTGKANWQEAMSHAL